MIRCTVDSVTHSRLGHQLRVKSDIGDSGLWLVSPKVAKVLATKIGHAITLPGLDGILAEGPQVPQLAAVL